MLVARFADEFAAERSCRHQVDARLGGNSGENINLRFQRHNSFKKACSLKHTRRHTLQVTAASPGRTLAGAHRARDIHSDPTCRSGLPLWIGLVYVNTRRSGSPCSACSLVKRRPADKGQRRAVFEFAESLLVDALRAHSVAGERLLPLAFRITRLY